MNYIITSQFGTVFGWGSCPEEAVEHIVPGPGRQLVLDIEPPNSQSTYFRYADGVLTDTGQPILPPSPGLSWDDEAARWVDARNLDQLKAAKWDSIKAARDAAEYGGFTWDGSTFDSDLASQQKIMGSAQLATLNSAYSVDWTLADNTVRHLTASDMTAVGEALGQHVNTQYVHARTLRQQIADAQTAQELDSIAW